MNDKESTKGQPRSSQYIKDIEGFIRECANIPLECGEAVTFQTRQIIFFFETCQK